MEGQRPVGELDVSFRPRFSVYNAVTYTPPRHISDEVSAPEQTGCYSTFVDPLASFLVAFRSTTSVESVDLSQQAPAMAFVLVSWKGLGPPRSTRGSTERLKD